MLNEQIVKKFKAFQKETGKHADLNIEQVEFVTKKLRELVSMPLKGGGTPNTKTNSFWTEDFNLVDNVNYFGWRNIDKKEFANKKIYKYSKVITKEAFESSSTWLVPQNSILIAIASASKGLLVINERPMCTNQNILGVVLNELNDVDYVYYCLKNIYRTLEGKKDYGNLTKGSEEEREIRIPQDLNHEYTSFQIQKALVEFLEYRNNLTSKTRDRVDKIRNVTEQIDSVILEKILTMKDSVICKKFDDWTKRRGYDIAAHRLVFDAIALSDNRYFVINPSKNEIVQEFIENNIEISFVPLENINPSSGTLDSSLMRLINDVYKGYTYFSEGDVIFTKVTPSMENGNIAIAQNLINGIGFGSSEYYVFRTNNINAKLLWSFMRQKSFRDAAKRTMRGSGGLKRVPKEFFDTVYLSVPQDIDNQYTSQKIQEILVEFIEAFYKWRDKIYRQTDAIKIRTEMIDEAILTQIFRGPNGN